MAEGDGFEDEPDAYLMDNIFFVPEKARWSVVSAAAHTPEIGSVIDDAMRAIEDENKTLKNVLPKNYASPDLDKRVLGDVVDLFTNMDMTDTEDSKDILGRTYEYCIAQFAAYEGVKGGEFYTPSSVVRTLVEILQPFEDCRVYDPCCGSGGMFVQSAKFVEAHQGSRNRISVYGQESNADTWKIDKIYPYYGATSCMDYVDNYIFDGKYLLLGEDGTVIDKNGYPILQYVEGKFWVNNHAHIITGKLGYTVEILYLIFILFCKRCY